MSAQMAGMHVSSQQGVERQWTTEAKGLSFRCGCAFPASFEAWKKPCKPIGQLLMSNYVVLAQGFPTICAILDSVVLQAGHLCLDLPKEAGGRR